MGGEASKPLPKALLRSETFINPEDNGTVKSMRRRSVLNEDQPLKRRYSTAQLLGDAPVSQAGAIEDAKRLHAGISYTYVPHPDHPTKCGLGLMREITLPVAGTYRIEATGASAADTRCGKHGGAGARVAATFDLVQGTTLRILCGAMSLPDTRGGRFSGAGGGGGTFIAINGNSPLLVAGGGGGSAGLNDCPDGRPGNLDESGDGAHGKLNRFADFTDGGWGGKKGHGGFGGPDGSNDGGGGWYTAGIPGGYKMRMDKMTAQEQRKWVLENGGGLRKGGESFLQGAAGAGLTGGYGGGGEACEGHGGGGGGYGGGGGGAGGGGGGSYVDKLRLPRKIVRDIAAGGSGGTSGKGHGFAFIQLLAVRAKEDQRRWRRNPKAAENWKRAFRKVKFTNQWQAMATERQRQRDKEAAELAIWTEKWEAGSKVRMELKLANSSPLYRASFRASRSARNAVTSVRGGLCCTGDAREGTAQDLKVRPAEEQDEVIVVDYAKYGGVYTAGAGVTPDGDGGVEEIEYGDDEEGIVGGDTPFDPEKVRLEWASAVRLSPQELTIRVMEMEDEERALFESVDLHEQELLLHMRPIERAALLAMQSQAQRQHYLELHTENEKLAMLRMFHREEQVKHKQAQRQARRATEMAKLQEQAKEKRRRDTRVKEEKSAAATLSRHAEEIVNKWVQEDKIHRHHLSIALHQAQDSTENDAATAAAAIVDDGCSADRCSCSSSSSSDSVRKRSNAGGSGGVGGLSAAAQVLLVWMQAVNEAARVLTTQGDTASGLSPSNVAHTTALSDQLLLAALKKVKTENGSYTPLLSRAVCPPPIRRMLMALLSRPPQVARPGDPGTGGRGTRRKTEDGKNGSRGGGMVRQNTLPTMVRKGSKTGDQVMPLLRMDVEVQCCVCLDEKPIKQMAICIFYVCGHFVCNNCCHKMLKTELTYKQNSHTCPMCRTPVLPDAGAWVAHNDEDTGNCTGFYHTSTGEFRSDRPPGSNKAEYWEQESASSYINKLTGERTRQCPK